MATTIREPANPIAAPLSVSKSSCRLTVYLSPASGVRTIEFAVRKDGQRAVGAVHRRGKRPLPFLLRRHAHADEPVGAVVRRRSRPKTLKGRCSCVAFPSKRKTPERLTTTIRPWGSINSDCGPLGVTALSIRRQSSFRGPTRSLPAPPKNSNRVGFDSMAMSRSAVGSYTGPSSVSRKKKRRPPLVSAAEDLLPHLSVGRPFEGLAGPVDGQQLIAGRHDGRQPRRVEKRAFGDALGRPDGKAQSPKQDRAADGNDRVSPDDPRQGRDRIVNHEQKHKHGDAQQQPSAPDVEPQAGDQPHPADQVDRVEQNERRGAEELRQKEQRPRHGLAQAAGRSPPARTFAERSGPSPEWR